MTKPFKTVVSRKTLNMKILERITASRTTDSPTTLPMYLHQRLKDSALFNTEERNSTELLLVQFPDLKNQSDSQEVLAEMKKFGVKSTSTNFFLSSLAVNPIIVKEGQIIHSMIAFDEPWEPDMCNWLCVKEKNSIPEGCFQLDTQDCVFYPENWFLVEGV